MLEHEKRFEQAMADYQDMTEATVVGMDLEKQFDVLSSRAKEISEKYPFIDYQERQDQHGMEFIFRLIFGDENRKLNGQIVVIRSVLHPREFTITMKMTKGEQGHQIQMNVHAGPDGFAITSSDESGPADSPFLGLLALESNRLVCGRLLDHLVIRLVESLKID
ncbi:hypothetical protein EXIGUO8H_430001 [Exiguobacterium sp. 8H]|uniref:hypothetical protein n=1 Tax=unclassified Exiguobacterium TaxID=2644629 RepID=UPI0012EF87DD|nr:MULTISPECIES: hypothetical protein [unclassified Exiguobacterium]VXC03687.1 hypothetical protein EXIGUO8A_680004 [Exiguobacterium sp. 8A]VXC04056.1 hypothetical protein EXIGUO8H_430001 [Exiguobacterium sp. 8H]